MDNLDAASVVWVKWSVYPWWPALFFRSWKEVDQAGLSDIKESGAKPIKKNEALVFFLGDNQYQVVRQEPDKIVAFTPKSIGLYRIQGSKKKMRKSQHTAIDVAKTLLPKDLAGKKNWFGQNLFFKKELHSKPHGPSSSHSSYSSPASSSEEGDEDSPQSGAQKKKISRKRQRLSDEIRNALEGQYKAIPGRRRKLNPSHTQKLALTKQQIKTISERCPVTHEALAAIPEMGKVVSVNRHVEDILSVTGGCLIKHNKQEARRKAEKKRSTHSKHEYLKKARIGNSDKPTVLTAANFTHSAANQRKSATGSPTAGPPTTLASITDLPSPPSPPQNHNKTPDQQGQQHQRLTDNTNGEESNMVFELLHICALCDDLGTASSGSTCKGIIPGGEHRKCFRWYCNSCLQKQMDCLLCGNSICQQVSKKNSPQPQANATINHERNSVGRPPPVSREQEASSSLTTSTENIAEMCMKMAAQHQELSSKFMDMVSALAAENTALTLVNNQLKKDKQVLETDIQKLQKEYKLLADQVDEIQSQYLSKSNGPNRR